MIKTWLHECVPKRAEDLYSTFNQLSPIECDACLIYICIIPNALWGMMISSNGDILRVTGPVCEEFTGHRWIPPHKGQWRGDLIFSLICAYGVRVMGVKENERMLANRYTGCLYWHPDFSVLSITGWSLHLCALGYILGYILPIFQAVTWRLT